jgi:hypothetical protein
MVYKRMIGIICGDFLMKILYFIENIYFGVGIGLTGTRCGLGGMDGAGGASLIMKKKGTGFGRKTGGRRRAI